jgi:hypothetical protein
MTERLQKLITFLVDSGYRNTQTFTTRNWVGDEMDTIYFADGIQVDYCYKYEYLEIFGVTDDEWVELAKVVEKDD